VAIDGIIELHRRIAREFRTREKYRLRMLLIGGGLTSPHFRQEEPENGGRFAGRPLSGPRQLRGARLRTLWTPLDVREKT
jgi:hypothetical protein